MRPTFIISLLQQSKVIIPANICHNPCQKKINLHLMECQTILYTYTPIMMVQVLNGTGFNCVQ